MCSTLFAGRNLHREDQGLFQFSLYHSEIRRVRVIPLDRVASFMKLWRLAPQVSFALTTGYALMGLNILIQLGLVPLYVQKLGKAQFGILMIIFSFINFAGLGVGWLSGGVARLLGEHAALQDHEKLARTYITAKVLYVGYAVAVVLLLGISGAVSFVSSGEWLGSSKWDDFVWLSIGIAALYFMAQYDFAIDRMTLVAMTKQPAVDMIQMVGLCVTALFVTTWLVSGGGMAGVLGGYLLGTLVARIGSWRYMKHAGLNIRPSLWSDSSKDPWKRLVGIRSGGYFIYGVMLLAMQADTMVIGWIGGPALAAEFALVWKIPEVIIQLIWRIPGAFEPYIIQLDTLGQYERIQDLYRQGFGWMLGASVFASLMYAVLGHPFVTLWVGTAQAPSSQLAYVFAALAMFWLCAVRWPAGFAHATVRLKQLNWVAGFELVGKLAIAIMLFPKLSYMAFFIAISLVHVLGAFWMYLRLGTYSKGRT